MRSILAAALFGVATQAGAATLALERAQIDRLAALPVGADMVIDNFPDGFGGSTSLRFKRIDVYATGARIIAMAADGEHELPRSRRIELIGTNAAGDVRASLAFDPGFAQLRGAGSSPGGAFAITASNGAKGMLFSVIPAKEALPPGVVPEIIPNEDGLPSSQPMPDALTLSLVGKTATANPRAAIVAVDVDRELLVNRFGGTGNANVSAATSWIADLFATMNVMYQRDLNVTLEQGTTIFRVSGTPYSISTNMSANSTDLGNFGTYWQDNEASVQRDFTVLLSGQLTGGFSASGIAWINAYCITSSNGGSYSVNKVFTSSSVGVDLSARLVGHELGHNFGAAHTHCTDVTTGAYSVATNTIDQCYKGESSSGCYGGAVSCPAGGAGTLMSYCNVGGSNGANCGQNALQFHSTQITTLSALIASNTPSCLSATTDLIFANGFD
ncbi:M12 family metallo-peptidase [Dokdonella soli]|uniref:Peptidase M12B domain-containing protein n=1 Tax=Dokdonella soli TaxID=529810 RepID=A0ABN1IG03_9GAMM